MWAWVDPTLRHVAVKGNWSAERLDGRWVLRHQDFDYMYWTLSGPPSGIADETAEAHLREFLEWEKSDSQRRTGVDERLVEVFKKEWGQAYNEGDSGNRVRRGLAAVLKELEN